MTAAHVEKFAEIVSKDPALLAKLGLDKANADAAAASASAEAFITNAVKEAKAHGLEFTEAEAHAFMADQAAAAARGELSDTQLEAVAGGKVMAEEHKQGLHKLGQILLGLTNTINMARYGNERIQRPE
jgi:multidrug resistance efflux pump